MTIVLLGASGHVGQAFLRALQARGQPTLPVSRKAVDYTQYGSLVAYLRSCRPRFLINAAGFVGKPNVDACEYARAETLLGNTVLPATIAHACEATGTPWGHVSSGCIYNGGWVVRDGIPRIETDLAPLSLSNCEAPDSLRGFTEEDEPNFCFDRLPCSFYSGCKAMAEQILADQERVFVWRLRIPFNEFDNPRNYLSKLQRYAKVYDNINSLSHLDDFVSACLYLWSHSAPFGIYNVTNPGFVTSRGVVVLIKRILCPSRDFEFWDGDRSFYREAAKTPRSNCILDTTKLANAGVALRDVNEAIEHSLKNWRGEQFF